jgi:hypothetical protein
MKLKRPDINKICEYLAKEVDGGVGKSIDYLLDQEFGFDTSNLTLEQCYQIDDTVFECAGCGWTMPSDMLSENEEDMICTDCDEE